MSFAQSLITLSTEHCGAKLLLKATQLKALAPLLRWEHPTQLKNSTKPQCIYRATFYIGQTSDFCRNVLHLKFSIWHENFKNNSVPNIECSIIMSKYATNIFFECIHLLNLDNELWFNWFNISFPLTKHE